MHIHQKGRSILSLFSGNMILYKENIKESTRKQKPKPQNLTGLISEFDKITR